MVIIPEREPYVHPLQPSWYEPHVKEIAMLRLDIIHPVVSGNKWYKLKENINAVHKNGSKGILTFGGAYSNHLVATAAAANAYNIHSVGIVRGTYASAKLTPTLASCRDYGMELAFISREEYAQKEHTSWLALLSQKYPGYFIVPEGGANEPGRKGAETIAALVPERFTHICLSVGTGTTLTGTRNALPKQQAVCGYVPMKGGRYMTEIIRPYIHNGYWDLFDEWNFGGFGKWNEELISFMNRFYQVNEIPLDIVYTGKMMYGITKQIRRGVFPKDSRILSIHTGGLQGNISANHLLGY